MLICFCSLASFTFKPELLWILTYYLMIKYMCHVNTKKVSELGVFRTWMTKWSIHLNFFPIYFCIFSQHHQSYFKTISYHVRSCYFSSPLLPTKVKRPHKKYFVIKEKNCINRIILSNQKTFLLKGCFLGKNCNCSHKRGNTIK